MSSLAAQEKQVGYLFQGVDFPSLTAADDFMRHNAYFGGLPAPSAAWVPFFRRQQASPGAGYSYLEYRFEDTNYLEAPGFMAFMTSNTSVDCNVSCPILDDFGNDFCTANIWPFCLSDGPIIETMLEVGSRPLCAAEVVSYPSYSPVLDNLGGFPVVWQFGNQNPIQASGFAQYRGELSIISYAVGCEYPLPLVESIYPHSSVYCPVGYNLLHRTETGYKCGNPLVARIYETGAITPEPTMSCSVENPCHPTTGNKTLLENDFTSPTLSFTRSYHSMTHYDDYASLGRGWTHDYVQRILDHPGQIVDAKKLLDGKGNIEHFECADSPVCSVYRSVSKAGKILMPIAGGWVFRAPNGEKRIFDAEGKLTRIERVEGNYTLLTVTYGAGGNIESVSDQVGRRLLFYYNGDGLLEALELPSGKLITYEYADPNPPSGAPVERQNLVKVVREDLTERLYHYEDRSPDGTPRNVFLLTGITDELGVRFATYVYDERARVVMSGHANGADLVTLDYTRRPGESLNWSITKVTSPLGEVISYDMDAGPFRKVQNIADSRGGVSFTYNSNWPWRSSKTDRQGNETTYRYDGLHETLRTEAAGTPDERAIETIWDGSLNRISELREPGKITRFSYNTRGQILSRTETDQQTQATRNWSYTYFEVPAPAPLIGRIRSADGPRTDVVDLESFEYYTSDDPEGRYLTGDLKAIVNALGHRTDFLRYDAEGRPMQIRDANNVMTELQYHARGWLSSRAIDGNSTFYNYDAAGSLTRITQPDGSFVRYEYDDAHRMNALEDALGNRIEFVLDAEGNRIEERAYDDSGALRRQLGRIYDQLSRPTTLLDGNGDATRLAYDSADGLTESTDPNDIIRTFVYDHLHRLVRSVDGMLGATVFEYDSRDNLASVTDPSGNITQFTYDGLDNRMEVNSPDTGWAGYEYDSAGNLTVATDARGISTEYGYDALNRLISVGHADSNLDVVLGYDEGSNGRGRLSSMVDASGRAEYSFDARGNLVREDRMAGAVRFSTSYAYDSADRLLRIGYPSGMTIDYVRDAAGHIRSLDQSFEGTRRTLVSDVRYEPFGPVTSFRYVNGMTYNAKYDQDYELHELRSGSDLDWFLDYDPAGNVLAITDRNNTQLDQAFTYDGLNRLRSASGEYGHEYFEYDANGNRIRYLSDQVEESYQYEPRSNRLMRQGDWTFTRNAVGDRTEKLDSSGFGYLYEYAEDKHLTRLGIRDADGDRSLAAYAYDGRGRRASASVDGVTTEYVYGAAGELLGVYAVNGDPLAEFIYLDGNPMAVFTTQIQTPPKMLLDVVIDNDEPGTTGTGKWKLKSNGNEFGDSYRLGDNSDTYRWTPEPMSGTFEIYVWWVPARKNSREAIYTVRHNGLSDKAIKNQNEAGGQWRLLGTFEFSGSGSEYVELGSGDGKMISADAVRFLEVGDDGANTSGTFFIHTDHLGTPRRVSDDAQSILWRWESRPFGNSPPDEDPDGDGSRFLLDLRLPGQYFEPESGLHYNYFRTYDPGTGRYIESDPIGLRGGYNPFRYVDNNPLGGIDPLGLVVIGSWIEPPRLNLTNVGVDDWKLVSPSWSSWGYAKFIRLFGHAAGFINVDVKCDSECKEWEIHNKISVAARGYHDVGPNLYAIIIGLRAGPVAGVGANVAIGGAALLAAEHHYLDVAGEKAGPLISSIFTLGPTGICLGSL